MKVLKTYKKFQYTVDMLCEVFGKENVEQFVLYSGSRERLFLTVKIPNIDHEFTLAANRFMSKRPHTSKQKERMLKGLRKYKKVEETKYEETRERRDISQDS